MKVNQWHNSAFPSILQMCVKHVSDQDNAGQHYKAVCRALVTEAKQLTTFLDNITRGQEVHLSCVTIKPVFRLTR